MEVDGRRINEVVIGEGNEYLKQYESVEEFLHESNALVETAKKAPNTAMNTATRLLNNPSSDFAGTNSSEEMREVADGRITTFLDEPALRAFMEESQDVLSQISLGGAFEKDRILVTDLPIGVFSFDLAARGLYIPQEYFSTDLNRLINPNLVLTSYSIDGTPIFTYKEDGKVYVLIQQQEGTYAVAQKEPDAKLVFRTTTRKVHLIRGGKSKLAKDDKGESKYVDLFVTIGGLASVTPTMMMYKAMPMILAASFLEKAGIKTRINAVLSGTNSARMDKNTNALFVSYPIKNYGQNFDYQKLAFETADPRVFRGRDFEYLAAYAQTKLGTDLGSGLGTSLQESDSEKQFLRFKNYLIDEARNGGARLFNQNKRLMIFGGKRYTDTINDTDVLKRDALDEFYRIINAVDIEFNGIEMAVKRIVEREMGNNISPNRIKQVLRGNVISKATDFDYSTSKYTDTPSEIRKQVATRIKWSRELGDLVDSEARKYQ